MIKSLSDKALRRFFETGATRGLSVQKVDRLRRILELLDAAAHPADLNQPGLRWHNLAPKQPSRYSVWVSGNYRITYVFDGSHAIDVDLEDYH
jgi:proteic killer suppression protein